MGDSDRRFIERSVRWGIVAAVSVTVGVALIWLLKSALTPLAVAFVLAYLLDPVIDRLQRFRIPRPAAILMFLAAWGLALAGFITFLVPVMQEEVVELSARLPGYLDRTLGAIPESVERTLGISVPESVHEGLERLREGSMDLPLDWIRDLLLRIGGLFSNTIGVLVGLLLIPVIAYHFLVQFDAMKQKTLEYVPLRYQDYVREKSQLVDRLISAFIRGQLTVCAILGILYAAGFLVIGIDLALVIGLVAGLLSIIPYVGSAVALFSASVMCVFQFGFDVHLLLIVGWYAVVQTFEGLLLTPRIVGGSLKLHPVTVILALLIGADLLGLLGLLIAVPAAAVIKVFVGEALAAYRRSSVYNG